MQNRTVVYTASRTIEDKDGSSFETGQPLFTEIFNVLVDEKHGNRSTPNAHWFVKFLQFDYNGTQGFESADGQNWIRVTGSLGSYASPIGDDWDFETVYNRALDDLYTQLRGDLDLSVSLLEGRQVLSMVKKCEMVAAMAGVLRHGSLALRRMRNIPQVLDTLKDLGQSQIRALDKLHARVSPRNYGNLWLEYQYGWKPLVSDVYGTFDSLMNRRMYQKVRVEASAQRKRTEKRVTYYAGIIPEVTAYDSSERVRIAALFTPPNDLRSQLGAYTSLNPVSIAWELLPYSFVVDWFVDVGGYLRNLESACLYQKAFNEGYMTHTRRSVVRTETNGSYTDSSGTTYRQTTGQALYREKRRTVLGFTPLPVVPSISPKLGVARLYSAAALLGQFLRR